MEKPLLGSFKRPPVLFQIPEEVPLSPSSLKEKLIFGSPETSPKAIFSWPNNSRSAPWDHDEDEGQHVVYIDDACACGKPFHAPRQESKAKGFDDSFIDGLIIGCRRRSEASLWNDLTKRDLDGVAASPKFRSMSPSPFAAWLLSDKDTGRKQEGRGSDNTSHAIDIPSGSPTKDCNICTKRILTRAQTAPSLTSRSEEKGKKANSAMPVVSQAFIGLLLYLAVGVLVFSWKKEDFSGSSTHFLIDAIYFCIVTMCTIGYGDIAPTTPVAKLFACAFVLVGFGFIDILLSGMVSFVLDKQETLLLSAVAAGQHETAKNYLVDVEKGRVRIRSKVTLAFGVVVMCLGVGTLVMHYLENLGWLDAFYLSCMSVTTVGYGDHAFTTMAGRVFASVWLLVSTLAVARSFIYLTEARIDRRHRLIAKLVLEQEMTIADMLAADLDNDGSLSKSDFVIFKLKKMGKVLDKDIHEICKQFSKLDTENSGKIDMSSVFKLRGTSSALK